MGLDFQRAERAERAERGTPHLCRKFACGRDHHRSESVCFGALQGGKDWECKTKRFTGAYEQQDTVMAGHGEPPPLGSSLGTL